jgi:hypothetical protein
MYTGRILNRQLLSPSSLGENRGRHSPPCSEPVFMQRVDGNFTKYLRC